MKKLTRNWEKTRVMHSDRGLASKIFKELLQTSWIRIREKWQDLNRLFTEKRT